MGIKVTAAMLAPIFAAPIPGYSNPVGMWTSREDREHIEAPAHTVDRKAHCVTVLSEILKDESEAARKLLSTFVREFGGNCYFWSGGAPDHPSLPQEATHRQCEIMLFFADPDGTINPERHRQLGGAFVHLVAQHSYERPEFWHRLREVFPQLKMLLDLVWASPEFAPARR